MTKKYGAVITAAGRSSRMGDFKPLLPLGASTIIGVTMDKLRAAGVSNFSVVVGREAARLCAEAAASDVVFAENAEYATTDMFCSVKMGLRALDSSCDYLFFLPVDTPLFELETLEKMKTAADGSCDVVIPTHRGKSGHPILLRGSAVPAILAYTAELGLGGAMKNLGLSVKRLECEDFGILLDADHKSDYELMRLLYGEDAPKNVMRHERAVARLSVHLADELNAAGFPIDTGLLELAALVHDCARAMPRHDEQAAEILRRIGRDDLAEIVRQHMLPEPVARDKISEITLLYLADKLVIEDRPATLEERFLSRLDKHPNEAARLAITEKYEIALDIKSMFEKALGRPI